ncbi:hypothetical protein DFJ74DRAFT_346104 [Hyaloraphidium curvatum]|nr:hypothetical protein DFJ74DRAFT_346104 [Hyaloraphidium curvatum]
MLRTRESPAREQSTLTHSGSRRVVLSGSSAQSSGVGEGGRPLAGGDDVQEHSNEAQRRRPILVDFELVLEAVLVRAAGTGRADLVLDVALAQRVRLEFREEVAREQLGDAAAVRHLRRRALASAAENNGVGHGGDAVDGLLRGLARRALRDPELLRGRLAATVRALGLPDGGVVGLDIRLAPPQGLAGLRDPVDDGVAAGLEGAEPVGLGQLGFAALRVVEEGAGTAEEGGTWARERG